MGEDRAKKPTGIWFDVAMAEALERLGRHDEALRKCDEVDAAFAEFLEDQMDFHGYSLTKLTLRSYVGFLRSAESQRSHALYMRAAALAVNICLKMQESSAGSAKEAGRQKKKGRRNKAKKGDKNFNKVNKSDKTDSSEDTLASCDVTAPDPLKRSEKYLSDLLRFAKDDSKTHRLAFDVYYRKEKPLLMLRSLAGLSRLSSGHEDLKWCRNKFQSYFEKRTGDLSETVKTVVDKCMLKYFGNVK